MTDHANDAELGRGEDGQFAWRTRFVNIGGVLPLAQGLAFSGQAMQDLTKAALGSPDGTGST